MLYIPHMPRQQTGAKRQRANGHINIKVKKWSIPLRSQRTPFFVSFCLSFVLFCDGVLSTHISRSVEREIDLQVAVSGRLLLIDRFLFNLTYFTRKAIFSIWASYLARKKIYQCTYHKKCSGGVSPTEIRLLLGCWIKRHAMWLWVQVLKTLFLKIKLVEI